MFKMLNFPTFGSKSYGTRTVCFAGLLLVPSILLLSVCVCKMLNFFPIFIIYCRTIQNVVVVAFVFIAANALLQLLLRLLLLAMMLLLLLLTLST